MNESIKFGNATPSPEKLAEDIAQMQKKLENARVKVSKVDDDIAHHLAFLEKMRERILRENAVAKAAPSDEAATDKLSDSLEEYSDVYAALERLRAKEKKISTALDGDGNKLDDAEENFRENLNS